MGGYIPVTTKGQQDMLAFLGIEETNELFADVPKELFCGELNLPNAKSEMEMRRIVEHHAAENTVFPTIFRGAGAYRHYIPSIVKQIASKETFVTAYTPYQAEISQGILQIIFEFQTEICSLTGMDVSNASVYDGATAAAEAVTMCRERKRQVALVASTCNPDTAAVIETYSNSLNAPVQTVPEKSGKIDAEALPAFLKDDVACLYVQSPNYNGLLEDVDALAALCHEAGVKLIYGCNPIALPLLKTPAESGADIAVGEAQPLGIPLGFGGPYLGFMASTKAMMRRLPGRIVGQTTDANGKRCFVLTLQAREQHIRREKATSSICTNQALCALTATAYLAVMGPDGMYKVATQCYSKAHYAAEELAKIGFERRYKDDYFNEFITTCPVEVDVVMQALETEGILGGLPCGNTILWCVTEMNTKDEIDKMVSICKGVATK